MCISNPGYTFAYKISVCYNQFSNKATIPATSYDTLNMESFIYMRDFPLTYWHSLMRH